MDHSSQDSTVTAVPLPIPEVALAIGAHPDDVEFGCGATLARWAESGCLVHLLICTDGSKGTWNPDADIEGLIRRRSIEAQSAARALGVTGEVVNLGYVDGELESGMDARNAVTMQIRRLRPQVVLGHDPWKMYRLHPDHLHAGRLAVDSVVAARDPHFFKEHLGDHGLAHHRPDALLLFEAEVVNHFEPAEDRHLDRRVKALMAHETQWETNHFHRLEDPSTKEEGFRSRERDLMAAAAAPFGEPLGEVFHLLDVR